jgi:Xaa-Pro aminopeptidase
MSRLAALQKRLKAEDVGGFLVTDPVNRNYLSGFTGSAGLLLVLAKAGWLVTDSRYWTQAGRELKAFGLYRQRKALLSEAVTLVKASKVRRLAVESSHMTVATHAQLTKNLPGCELVPVSGWVEALRAVKDKAEQAVMRRACRITEAAFEHCLAMMRPGVAEVEVAACLESFMRRAGAEGPSFDTIVASGSRGALPHGRASDKRLALGDLVVMDFGCRLGEHCSDFTRTVCVGKAGPLQKKVYRVVQEAQARARKGIRAGRSCGQVDDLARLYIRKQGYGKLFGHGLGHGVGREVHEEPRLTPGSRSRLAAGMAVTVEPGIYLPGRFGVRIEDLVFVTPTGSEDLYRVTRDLIELNR